MNLNHPDSPRRGLLRSPVLRLLALLAFAVTTAFAQTASPTGTISGRVQDSTNGKYLKNAEVSIGGSQRTTLTNEYGEYRLTDVPAGEVTVKVFYSGLDSQTAAVTLADGGSAQKDFVLGHGKAPEDGKVLTLDTYTVAASREASGQAVAVNEQRYASNIKNVLSADQFGDVPEGNVGEFLKFVPGVVVDYNAGDVRWISVRGVAPIYTSVTVDGAKMASAASSNNARYFEMEQVSMNNVARVEVVKSRTPDISADALGGSVNMISKSAFEFSQPKLDYRAYGIANSEYMTLGKTPGPLNEPERKVQPGFDITYVKPVNKNFGFTATASVSNMANPQYRSNPQWSPNGTNSNITGMTPDSPFLRTYTMQDAPKNTNRYSLGATADWRFAPNDVLTFTFQDNYYNAYFGARAFTINAGGVAPASYGYDYTQGAATRGTAQISTGYRRKFGTTFNLGARWKHNGPTWRLDGGYTYSHASNHYRNESEGYPNSVSYLINNVTARYDGVSTYDEGVRPATISVTNAAGAAIDYTNVNNYTIQSMQYDPTDAYDVYHTAGFNAARVLNTRLPTLVKAGVQAQFQIRDIQRPSYAYTFVGPDKVANTADDLASLYNLVDASYSTVTPPFGFTHFTWPSNFSINDLRLAHPEYFVLNEAGAIQNRVNASMHFKELISAAYLMGDTRSRDNKLRLVYGLRFERTDDEGQGPLVDQSAIYQKDASGNIIHDSAGKPILITTNSLEQTKLKYQERAATVKNDYSGVYPSFNLSYEILEGLIFRAAYSRSIGRPDFASIIPNMQLPDLTTTTTPAITVTNIALKPEESNNYDLALEYYLNSAGIVSVGVFQKDFSNFWGTSTQPATIELLNELGVPDPELYTNGTVTSRFNVGEAQVKGVELNFQQALSFKSMPDWARGISFFANATFNNLKGSKLADFTDFIEETANWGISFNSRKFGLKLKWNHRGLQRLTSLSYDPSLDAYEYYAPRTYLDIDMEYRFTKHFGLFFNGRNMTDEPQDRLRYGPSTPDYAKLYWREQFGTTMTLGVKGTF